MSAFSLWTRSLAGTRPQRKQSWAFLSARQAVQASSHAPPWPALQPALEPHAHPITPCSPIPKSPTRQLHCSFSALASSHNTEFLLYKLKPTEPLGEARHSGGLSSSGPSGNTPEGKLQFYDPRMDAIKQESNAVAIRKTNGMETRARQKFPFISENTTMPLYKPSSGFCARVRNIMPVP